MIERILTPLDGSLTAEAVLPQVERLARRTAAEIVLARAIPTVGLEPADLAFQADVRAATEYLDGIQARLEWRGLRASSITRVGHPAETLLSLAAETRADLLAVATHGRTGAARLAMGSVAETLLRSTPIPVLALRPFWTYELKPAGGVEAQSVRTILLPVGSGGLSLCALPHAVQMAKIFGARVMVLHASSASEEPAAETVADIAERFRLEGIDATTLVEPGDAAETILSACRSRAVDLVVMSTHGRSGLPRLVLGSVTERVLREARVPLLVVRGNPSARVAWRLKSGSTSSP